MGVGFGVERGRDVGGRKEKEVGVFVFIFPRSHNQNYNRNHNQDRNHDRSHDHNHIDFNDSKRK